MKTGQESRYGIRNILLIEDNILDISLFTQYFRKSDLADVSLTSAVTLQEGHALIEKSKPDALFLDLNLPDSLGLDTYLATRKRFPGLPIVIITGIEDRALALEALRQGAQDYLLKRELSAEQISRSLRYAVERKKIENELERSRYNFEAIIENSGDAIWSVNKNFTLVTCNLRFARSIEKLCGTRPSLGDNLLSFLPGGQHEFFTAVSARALAGETFRIEKKLTFGTREHDIELSVNPVRMEGGKITGVSFFGRNIDRRKADELRIRQSENAYKLLLESINDGIMFVDNDNQMRFANRKFLETTGFAENELIGRNFNSLLAGQASESDRNLAEESLLHEDPVEILIKTKSGREIWYRVKATPLLDETGGIAGALLTHTEITEVKQAEATLRKKEQDYTSLLETMNEGLVYLDEQGGVRFANQRFIEMTGIPLSGLIGKRLPHAVLPETMLDLIIEEQSVLPHNESSYQYEIQAAARESQRKWFLINCSVVRDESGKLTGILITYSDINDRKTAEEKLQRAERELNTFIYRSSHDLKGPLSSILGLIGLLEKDAESSSGSPVVKMIRQSATKLDRMLNEMLSVVRMKREKAFPEPINFRSVLTEVVQGLRTIDSFYDVRRDLRIENKKEHRTDKKLLQLILHNLMDNSIRYRNPAVDSFVTVYIYDSAQGFSIEIEDNGLGFETTARENIFRMFNRGNFISEGTGLGLYIVKNAVDRLGGSIDLECGSGKHTKFTIFLPEMHSSEELPEQTATLS
jgi:PAS domain S-box-containing protein